MQYLKGIEQYQGVDPLAITLGKFDGLHLGHQVLIDSMRKETNPQMKNMVFAFDMTRFRKEGKLSAKQIMLNRERQQRLEGTVDYLLECPFTQEIQCMRADLFVSEVLVHKLHAKVIVVGSDFRFGFQQTGDAKLLAQYADKYDYKVIIIEKELYQNREISSTFIKEAICDGNLVLANELLGYHYSVEGEVIHGNKLGRTLGFPTMNIRPDTKKLLPPNGVYVCKTTIEGQCYHGIGNIGCKPTVSEEHIVQLEVNLFNFSKEFYGKDICVELLEFVRKEQRFDSVEQLKEQVEKDILFVEKYVYNK